MGYKGKIEIEAGIKKNLVFVLSRIRRWTAGIMSVYEHTHHVILMLPEIRVSVTINEMNVDSTAGDVVLCQNSP